MNCPDCGYGEPYVQIYATGYFCSSCGNAWKRSLGIPWISIAKEKPPENDSKYYLVYCGGFGPYISKWYGETDPDRPYEHGWKICLGPEVTHWAHLTKPEDS